MKRLTRFRGVFAVAVALLLAYPAFRFGQYIGNEAAELPQVFMARPGMMVVGVALNIVLVGVLFWLIFVWPPRAPTSEQS